MLAQVRQHQRQQGAAYQHTVGIAVWSPRPFGRFHPPVRLIHQIQPFAHARAQHYHCFPSLVALPIGLLTNSILSTPRRLFAFDNFAHPSISGIRMKQEPKGGHIGYVRLCPSQAAKASNSARWTKTGRGIFTRSVLEGDMEKRGAGHSWQRTKARVSEKVDSSSENNSL
jgi:hypothetical protein